MREGDIFQDGEFRVQLSMAPHAGCLQRLVFRNVSAGGIPPGLQLKGRGRPMGIVAECAVLTGRFMDILAAELFPHDRMTQKTDIIALGVQQVIVF